MTTEEGDVFLFNSVGIRASFRAKTGKKPYGNNARDFKCRVPTGVLTKPYILIEKKNK